jgi:hypothetical protein
MAGVVLNEGGSGVPVGQNDVEDLTLAKIMIR